MLLPSKHRKKIIISSIIAIIMIFFISLIFIGRSAEMNFTKVIINPGKIPKINKEIAIFNTNPLNDNKNELFISIVTLKDKLMSDILKKINVDNEKTNKVSNDNKNANNNKNTNDNKNKIKTNNNNNDNNNNDNLNNDNTFDTKLENIFNRPLPLNIIALMKSTDLNILSKFGHYLYSFTSSSTLNAFKEFINSIDLFLKNNSCDAIMIVKINPENLVLNEFVVDKIKDIIVNKSSKTIEFPENRSMKCMNYLMKVIINGNE
ncbi:hypothetical protein DMUE_3650 [Dictyocoela muelleri]|nr:hypothetical protein DMUE_3650 [Dictyocoela muelleri]